MLKKVSKRGSRFCSSIANYPAWSNLKKKHPLHSNDFIIFEGKRIELPSNSNGTIHGGIIGSYGEKSILNSLSALESNDCVSLVGEESAQNMYFSISLYLNSRSLWLHYYDGWWVACHWKKGLHFFESEKEADICAYKFGGTGWYINCVGREIMYHIKK
mmetsp:Transcript_100536/g.123069  ORF Transcript_100536/g.123069 Transcript_100536/m.123069 type:complete len:159 (+) Transcript_100536:13-489(+)